MLKKILVLGAVVVAGCLAAGLASAGDEDVEIRDEDVKIRIEKIVDCDDDSDCEDGRRVMVFVGEDGETVELKGDANVWVGHHGLHDRRFFGHGGGFLGVGLSELTPELRLHFGVPEDAGVMISKVIDDSPASRAGIQVGDIITAVDAEAVSSGRELARAIRGLEDSTATVLELWRDGRVDNVTATVEERQAPQRSWSFSAGDHDFGCGGAEDCAVEVRCGDGAACNCSVNGESVDCRDIDRLRHDE